MKNTIYVLSTFLLLLFSCQPEVHRNPEILNRQELQEKLLQIEAFHEFQDAERNFRQEIDEKWENLDPKDHWWIRYIHEKYPSIEHLLSKASPSSIRKYALLTGIDVLEGNHLISQSLQKIHEELDDRYIFQVSDLNELLFLRNEGKKPEHSYAKTNCLRFCDNAANDEFIRVLESCERSDLMYCQYQALMARHYFHRGCMAGCNYPEE